MTKENKKKLLSEESLRHNEYYGMQGVFDKLYAQSKNGEVFENLMPKILSRENILLAYRNIKANTGSKTAGTDGLTIGDIGRLPPDEVVTKVRFIVEGSKHGYRPKPVRRKEIPKPYDPTQTRPLGIPCIWDRLIQQCVKQVMEPICEAGFSNNSYGFRPNRSVENAIARSYQLLQIANLHYVIEFDIKGFFDNVDHSKLMRQIWAMGIHDKHLIYVLRKMLAAPIKLENGVQIVPDKGTPQGGIISPLLANIVLNELDHWIESQWQYSPLCTRCSRPNNGYRTAKKTGLKEMFIVRYADDFRIFCRTKKAAERTKIAVTQWLAERLKLEVSQEKTRIVNVKRHYSNFLGFKMKVHPKGEKQAVMSYIADKNLLHKRRKLVEQAKRIAKPRKSYGEAGEIQLYNSMVTGMQNYYQIATHVNLDYSKLNRAVMVVLTNRLSTRRGNRLSRSGRKLTDFERKRYGKSKMLRYVAGTNEPKAPLDVDMVLPQGEGGHQALLLLVVQPHQGAIIFLRHASGPEYLIAQLPLGVGHVQDKERHHEKAFVPGLQFGKQLLGVRAVGGKVGGQNIHIVAGAHRLFLLLYLHGVQVGDLPLYPFDTGRTVCPEMKKAPNFFSKIRCSGCGLYPVFSAGSGAVPAPAVLSTG